ncbi:hypothetical protein IEQ34_018996 [Dendrobium chrysotoxum]|uniref:Uncharacterized protein n=1 Tax=Dendrobium chrysotoxum TaxID=161865 RepID=A0AAV7G865_DENCH|nr:hypothetical protein IEQ34_018996 [Dendrobium chrysotoxum]
MCKHLRHEKSPFLSIGRSLQSSKLLFVRYSNERKSRCASIDILDNRLKSSINRSWIELTSTIITFSCTMDDEEDAANEVKVGINWDNRSKEDNRLETIEEVVPAISKP